MFKKKARISSEESAGGNRNTFKAAAETASKHCLALAISISQAVPSVALCDCSGPRGQDAESKRHVGLMIGCKARAPKPERMDRDTTPATGTAAMHLPPGSRYVRGVPCVGREGRDCWALLAKLSIRPHRLPVVAEDEPYRMGRRAETLLRAVVTRKAVLERVPRRGSLRAPFAPSEGGREQQQKHIKPALEIWSTCCVDCNSAHPCSGPCMTRRDVVEQRACERPAGGDLSARVAASRNTA